VTVFPSEPLLDYVRVWPEWPYYPVEPNVEVVLSASDHPILSFMYWVIYEPGYPPGGPNVHDPNATIRIVMMADREVVAVFDPPCGEGAAMMLGVSLSLLVMSRFVSRRRLHGAA